MVGSAAENTVCPNELSNMASISAVKINGKRG